MKIAPRKNSKIHLACSTDALRSTLQFVCFDRAENALVATDGHLLLTEKVQHVQDWPEQLQFAFIHSRVFAEGMKSYLQHFEVSDDGLIASTVQRDYCSMTSFYNGGNYPNWRRVIPGGDVIDTIHIPHVWLNAKFMPKKDSYARVVFLKKEQKAIALKASYDFKLNVENFAEVPEPECVGIMDRHKPLHATCSFNLALLRRCYLATGLHKEKSGLALQALTGNGGTRAYRVAGTDSVSIVMPMRCVEGESIELDAARYLLKNN